MDTGNQTLRGLRLILMLGAENDEKRSLRLYNEVKISGTNCVMRQWRHGKPVVSLE
jgi:hypothetical protein